MTEPSLRHPSRRGGSNSLTIILIGILAITLLAPSPDHDVSFSLAIQGYALAPVSRTIEVTAIATGKQYVPATAATRTITFYKGAIYAQIIPFDTVLTGADGIRVVTDEQAVIPPAAQTTPPTYGHVSVAAHALIPGKAGNIQAGDINEACCVTSVISLSVSMESPCTATYDASFLLDYSRCSQTRCIPCASHDVKSL